jgi:hypothetical protein
MSREGNSMRSIAYDSHDVAIVLDGQKIPVSNLTIREDPGFDLDDQVMVVRQPTIRVTARTIRPAHHRDLMLVASDRFEELGDAAMAKALREAAKE